MSNAATYDFDLYVIGAGSGGVRAARIAAGLGARVGVCEERYMGGTCVNVGCVPKKLFVYASAYSDAFRAAAGFGHTVGDAHFEWGELLRNKNAEISRLNAIYRRMLDRSGAVVHDGRGHIVDAHTVEVNGVRHTTERILVATGGRPTRPDVPGADLALVSEDVFTMTRVPKRALVVGGGYIGLEFASIWHGLGADVTLIHRGQHVLRGFDADIRRHVEKQFAARGIPIHLGTEVARIEAAGDSRRVTLVGREAGEVEVDTVLFATGRRPNTDGVGLEEVGVELGSYGEIRVDEDFQTRVPSIYAVGDVVDRFQLTPVALEEGMALAKSLFGGQPTRPQYDLVPTAVFTRPEVATVGLTEEQARARHGDDVTIFRSDFRPLGGTLSGGPERTLMKLVVQTSSDRVLGCHIAGEHAAEILQGFAVALRCGATKAQLDATIGIHPTAAEELVTMRTPVTPGTT